MTTAEPGDCRRHEPPRLRAPTGVAGRRFGVCAHGRSRRRRSGVGDSLAVLLRVPERGHQPQNLERRGDYPGAGMAPVRSVDRIAIEPHDRRDRGLHGHSGAIRTSPPTLWAEWSTTPVLPHSALLTGSKPCSHATGTSPCFRSCAPAILSSPGGCRTVERRIRDVELMATDATYALPFGPGVLRGRSSPSSRCATRPRGTSGRSPGPKRTPGVDVRMVSFGRQAHADSLAIVAKLPAVAFRS